MVWFAVTVGRKHGLFTDAVQYHDATADYPGAMSCRWDTLDDAVSYLYSNGLRDLFIHNPPYDSERLLKYCKRNGLSMPKKVAYSGKTKFEVCPGCSIQVFQAFQSDEPHIMLKQKDFCTGRAVVINLESGDWRTLQCLAPQFKEAMSKVKAGESLYTSQCIGNCIFLTIQSPIQGYDIRRWFMQGDEFKPSIRSILLKEWEFEHLINIAHLVTAAYQHVVNESFTTMEMTIAEQKHEIASLKKRLCNANEKLLNSSCVNF